jgi:hypothetical protein
MTDFLTALRAYLLAQKDVTDLCGRAVFVLAVPQEELTRESSTGVVGAHKIVVLLASGGEMKGSSSRTVTAAKVDVVCYGETDFDAAKLERAVAEALKSLNREVCEGVLLHNVTLASGPTQARDPEIFWPVMRRQAIVRADERSL